MKSTLFHLALLTLSWTAYAQKPQPLAWPPPKLENPTVVNVTATNRWLRLRPDHDYVVKMPSTPLRTKMGLKITGGRNVVLIGGAIEALSEKEAPDPKDRRALYLDGQTGTIHVEGLHIRGASLAEGIQFDERLGATVQFENIRIETVHGFYEGWHADIVQTWAGPRVLRIDRLTASTGYQGFFLMPNQRFENGAPPEAFDLRHINITGNEKSAFLLWIQVDPRFPVSIRDVWVKPPPEKTSRERFLWPKPKATGDHTWDAVRVGDPPEGDFVPAGVAGVGYVSPGYGDPTEHETNP